MFVFIYLFYIRTRKRAENYTKANGIRHKWKYVVLRTRQTAFLFYFTSSQNPGSFLGALTHKRDFFTDGCLAAKLVITASLSHVQIRAGQVAWACVDGADVQTAADKCRQVADHPCRDRYARLPGVEESKKKKEAAIKKKRKHTNGHHVSGPNMS